MEGLRAAAVAAVLLAMAWMVPVAVESGAEQQQARAGDDRCRVPPAGAHRLSPLCCCRSSLPIRRGC